MDFTHPSNLAGLVNPSNNLKESAKLLPKADTSSYTNIYHSTEMPSKPKEEVAPSFSVETKKIENPASSYTDTFTYSSQTNSNNYGYDSLTSKSGLQQQTTGINSADLFPSSVSPTSDFQNDLNKYSSQWNANTDFAKQKKDL